MNDQSRPPRGPRRGISLLPAAITCGNIFLGFWAIVRALHGEYARAAPLILGAIIFDMLDGRIARLTNTVSDFGAELDSLADVISFGVAPAVLALCWGFSTLPRVGWLTAFLFVICGTIRLARFNVQRSAVDGRFFVGLPIPAAAGQVAVWVNAFHDPLRDRYTSTIAVAFMVVLAFLMVSTFRYPSFKKFDLRKRRSSINVVFIAVVITVIALHPQWALLTLGTIYWLSAPLMYVVGLALRRPRQPPPPAVPAVTQS